MQYDVREFNIHSEADISQLNVTNDVKMKSQVIKTKQKTFEQNKNKIDHKSRANQNFAARP